MGCLFAVVALITPRFVLFVLWLFTDYMNTAISSGWSTRRSTATPAWTSW